MAVDDECSCVVVAGYHARQVIVSSIDEWEAVTCLRFRPAMTQDVNYVVFQTGTVCSSNIGMLGHRQNITLGSTCIKVIFTRRHMGIVVFN